MNQSGAHIATPNARKRHHSAVDNQHTKVNKNETYSNRQEPPAPSNTVAAANAARLFALNEKRKEHHAFWTKHGATTISLAGDTDNSDSECIPGLWYPPADCGD
jgi:hypothetical protein